jgi:propanol-preferring alcohol dehydrogenase
MKAAVLHEFGKPLRIEDVPRPEPAAGEVLVKVEACGVCHSDLHIMQKDWPDAAAALQLPAILGHEVVGRVVETAQGVEEPAVGDRVGVGWLHWTCGECECCHGGHENLCDERKITGFAAPGGYAEYMRAKASHVIRVPEELSPAEAAPFFCAGVTAYHACQEASIIAGQHVAVFGIGGLGHLALQLAQELGAKTTAVDLSDEKLQVARSMGVHQAVDASSQDAERLLKAEGGPHVAVVTATTEAAYDLALRTLRRRGTLVVVGLPSQALRLVADDIATGEFRILGSAVGTRDDLRRTLEMAAARKLLCHTETFPLESINEIFTRMQRNEISGRAVITFE